MKAEFIDMEPSRGRPDKVCIATVDEMSALLEESRERDPFFFELAPENGHSLTVGLASAVGSVQFSSTTGEPPYLEAVAPDRPALGAGEMHNLYGAAVRADELAGFVPVEFRCGGTATPVPSRYIVSFERLTEIAVYFMPTGKPYPGVLWEEI